MLGDDALYLVHILEMARKAVAKVENLVREDYDDDENLRLAPDSSHSGKWSSGICLR